MQRKEESVSEYTERFCQSAAAYSGIADTPEKVLDHKGPLVRTWFDFPVKVYWEKSILYITQKNNMHI